jgi:erythromycin esterase
MQNAAVVYNGERYIKDKAVNSIYAWNTRDRHMAETVNRITTYYGAGTKVVVWAHNTHVGDARYTDIPGRGRSNIGEMLRDNWGNENVFIVGFGSYQGSVVAA